MTNNKQQTAVEWLWDQMFDPTYPAGEQMEWLEEAKEMEQNQITLAHIDAAIFTEWDENTDARKNADQYYEQIYGGGEQ
jgi:hypothetical protein